MMRLNIVVFLCLAGLTYAATLYFDKGSAPLPPVVVQPDSVVAPMTKGEILPEFSFQTPDGKTHHSIDFKGKIVILNFWASWCPPCVKEFPDLLAVAAAFPTEVVLIALSSDLDEAAMTAFLKKQTLEKTPGNVFVALDTDQAITQKIFQTYQLPETILIDKAQVMRSKIAGSDWSVEEMEEQIKGLQ